MAGNGRIRIQSCRARLDEAVHRTLRIGWQPWIAGRGQSCGPRLIPCSLVRTALALCMLFLPGCAHLRPTHVPSVTLALLGDVMLGRSVHPSLETFSYLEPSLVSADLVLANLESPLTDSPVQTESAYALCAAPENVKYLVAAGLDL